MTEQTQPTDAELGQLAKECGIGWAAGLGGIDDFLRNFARAVLAKWGTPAGAGEVVAWGIFDSQGFYEAASDQESAERFCAHYNKRKGADPLKPYTAKPLTTPQPTQAQAWAVPLTVQYPEGYGNPFAKIAYDAGWRAAEHAHGIKGADHG